VRGRRGSARDFEFARLEYEKVGAPQQGAPAQSLHAFAELSTQLPGFYAVCSLAGVVTGSCRPYAGRMLARPSALLFDLDGTLVDSVADLTASLNQVRARHRAAPHPAETVRRFVGDGAWRLVERGVADLGLDVNEALAEFRAHYGAHCLDRTRPYAGIEPMLEGLASIPCAVVSNKPQAFCETIVRGLGWDRRFGAVVGARSGVAVKPAADLLALAAAQLGVALAECWMIGDSPNDLRAARAAGCVGVGVGWGLVAAEIVRAEAPALWLQQPADLLTLLRGADRPESGTSS
jgi:phosphoglycolate phosphatase